MTLKGVKEMTYREYEKSPGIRHSQLQHMARSPAHFKAALETDDEPTRPMIIGRIWHTSVLEPNLFLMSHYVRPLTYTDKNGVAKKWNGNAFECKAWIEDHDDRPVISSDELDAVLGMKKSIMEHPAAAIPLEQGTSELCIFWQDPETGIGCKARLDLPSGNTILDLKSTEDASKEGFPGSVGKYHYDSQSAFYLDGANILGLEKHYFVFAATEKKPPYACAMHQLDPESIDLGRRKYRRWLDLLSHCMETDDWPGYDTAINTIRVKDYEFRKEQNLLLTG